MEDEIASICACIGASLAGQVAMTATSGPGFSLMQEAIGYAIMVEAPLVIVDVMRAGPVHRPSHRALARATSCRPAGAPTATTRPSCWPPPTSPTCTG